MAPWRSTVKRALSSCPPVGRTAAAAAAAENEGARLRAAGRVVRHEVLTRGFGIPVVVPIGEHSKIMARKGESNSPLAVRKNPPNYCMYVWRAHLRPGDLFIDVGANIGIYTVFARDLGAEVIAVEPTANAERVRENLRLNGYDGTVLQQALSDRAGRVRITEHLDSRNHLVTDGSGGVEVPATTLDDVLGDRTADGVKIDVEGAERLVLQGASRALAEGRIRLMQLEWVGERAAETLGEARDPTTELLVGHGYRLYRPDRRGHLQPIVGEVPELHDVFACAPGVQLDPRLLEGFSEPRRSR